MIDVKNLAGIFAKKAIDNSPAILTAVGAAGVVSTAVLAVKATPGASKKIFFANEELEWKDADTPPEPLGKFQVVKLVWKDYIPTALSASAAIAAIIAANTVNTRRYAAIATAYSLSEHAYKEYREKTIEQVGRVKEEEIRAEVGKDQFKRASDNGEVIWLGNGESQFWDATSGRAFKSSMETIRKAENDINFEIINGSYASLNDFWSKIGLPTTRWGDEVGWTLSEPLALQNPYGMVLPDNTPAIGIDFATDPVRNYNKLG